MITASDPWNEQTYQKMTHVLGITNEEDQFDQKTNTFALRPGYKLAINLVPEEVQATQEFGHLDRETRKCKFPNEIEKSRFMIRN